MALKWGSVDLLGGKATISLSRHLGEENATKTRASRRTIALLPNVVELLKSILPLRVEPNSYVFTDGQGKPIEQSRIRARISSCAARAEDSPAAVLQRAPHLYQCCAYHRCNQKWIAEQTGTSIAMIQDHYGQYIRDDGDALSEHTLSSRN